MLQWQGSSNLNALGALEPAAKLNMNPASNLKQRKYGNVIEIWMLVVIKAQCVIVFALVFTAAIAIAIALHS